MRKAAIPILLSLVAASALSACGTASSPAPSAAVASALPSASAAVPSRSLAVASATAAVGAPCEATVIAFDPKKVDLTGTWAGDDDGIYYLRQRGQILWWNGMSSRAGPATELGRDWNNVGRGEIKNDLTVQADWADVPRGEIMGYGTLTLKIDADASGNIQIRKIGETGKGFGNTRWTPCSPG
jgi:hypothetical protein